MAAAPNRRRGVWLLLGGLSAVGYAVAAWVVGASAAGLQWMLWLFAGLAVVWAIALRTAVREPPKPGVVLLFAIMFRLLVLPAGYSPSRGSFDRLLLFDDDVWTYVWEGHAWSAGVNPLVTPPGQVDPFGPEEGTRRLAALYPTSAWVDVFDNLGNRDRASRHPLGAQALFRLAHVFAPGDVLLWKVAMTLFDLGTVLLLARAARHRGRGMAPVVAYAWNPLVIKAFAGSGHIDAAFVFLITLAATASGSLGGVALALAGLIGPMAWLLAPAIVRRNGWKSLPVLAAGALLLGMGWPMGLIPFLAESRFNAILGRVFPLPALGLLIASFLVVGAVVWYRDRQDDGSTTHLSNTGLWLFGSLLLLTPVLEPWYLTWLLPFAAMELSSFWLALSSTVILAYHSYLDGTEHPVLVACQFAVPLLLWWWTLRAGRDAEESTDPMPLSAVVSVSSSAAAVAGLCCLSPIALVLFGLSSVSFAAGMGNVLYGEYRWFFRAAAAVTGCGATVVYLRTRGVCTLDAVRRRRRFVTDVVVLTGFGTLTAYLFLTYVVLQAWGIQVGLPWAEYDESWAVPVVCITLLITGLVFSVSRQPSRPPAGRN